MHELLYVQNDREKGHKDKQTNRKPTNEHGLPGSFWHLLCLNKMARTSGIRKRMDISNACCFLFQSGKDKWMTQRCIASDCKRTARLGSVFCSNSCIVRHARHALKQLRLEREKTTGHKVSRDQQGSEF